MVPICIRDRNGTNISAASRRDLVNDLRPVCINVLCPCYVVYDWLTFWIEQHVRLLSDVWARKEGLPLVDITCDESAAPPFTADSLKLWGIFCKLWECEFAFGPGCLWRRAGTCVEEELREHYIGGDHACDGIPHTCEHEVRSPHLPRYICFYVFLPEFVPPAWMAGTVEFSNRGQDWSRWWFGLSDVDKLVSVADEHLQKWPSVCFYADESVWHGNRVFLHDVHLLQKLHEYDWQSALQVKHHIQHWLQLIVMPRVNTRHEATARYEATKCGSHNIFQLWWPTRSILCEGSNDHQRVRTSLILKQKQILGKRFN